MRGEECGLCRRRVQWAVNAMENSRLHSLHSPLSLPSLFRSVEFICVFNKSRYNVAKVHRTHK